MQETFQVKDIQTTAPHGSLKTFRILSQNQNGPCPLLALANILILQDKITLGAAPSVDFDALTGLIGDCLLGKIQESQQGNAF